MNGYHRNKDASHKRVRNYVTSYINHIIHDKNKLDNFIFPSHISNTYTWTDCKPHKPKPFKINGALISGF